MSPLDIDTVLAWRGRTVLDRDGEKIGTLGDIYLDRRTERPGWAKVRTGLFGMKESFIPLEAAEPAGEDLRVPYEKDVVRGAPSVDPEVELGEDEEAALFRHYGRGDGESVGAGADLSASAARDDDADTEDRERERAGASAGAGDEDRHRAGDEGRTVDDDAASGGGGDRVEVVRSEEEIRVGTRWRPAERLRLKKVLVTDHVEREVPVRREHVVVEKDPPER